MSKEKLTLANGDTYEGETVNGKPDGKGKMTYANGTVEEGEWFEGGFIGPVTEESADDYAIRLKHEICP
jgi:hypothetical protein